jgi:hypothetical protein
MEMTKSRFFSAYFKAKFGQSRFTARRSSAEGRVSAGVGGVQLVITPRRGAPPSPAGRPPRPEPGSEGSTTRPKYFKTGFADAASAARRASDAAARAAERLSSPGKPMAEGTAGGRKTGVTVTKSAKWKTSV